MVFDDKKMNAFEESREVSDIFLHTTAAGAITCVSFARTGVKTVLDQRCDSETRL